MELQSKKFSKENKVFDIVLYGSAARSKEEPNDIDILMIFVNETLEKRLEILQKFKSIVKAGMIKVFPIIKNLDVKTINLPELFDKNLLSKEGIIVEGFSLVHHKPFSSSIGFKGYVLFLYDLKNMNHNEKTKFTYALIGRNNEGILKITNSNQFGKGSISAPIENSEIVEDFMKKWKVNYRKKKILISEA
ncbi:MAG: nucleotidyltransferase domain-containing protein [Nanoarchaeota archaeon]|nr:nucleotidyltransferase domain-containing protein [Nanoarchaeota archaeon]